MTAPRQNIANRTHLVTRRCTQRMCLLRPDAEANQIFLYSLANAAHKTGVQILTSLVMSNHHHTIVYDPKGRISEFCHELHGMVARAMNRLRRRSENLWAREETSIVRLVDRHDVLEKMAYVAHNPVKAHLVEHTEHWPGINTIDAFLRGQSVSVERPRVFFRERGKLPASLTFTCEWPAHLGCALEARRALRDRIDELAERARQQRVSERRTVAGRTAVLKQDFNARPSTVEGRRQMRPRIAAGERLARVAAWLAYRAFREAYREARKLWSSHKPAVFPAGTYLLSRIPGVIVATTSGASELS